MIKKIEYNNKVSYLLFFTFTYWLGYFFDNIFLSVFINQLILLYIILFIYSYNIWSLTSQFNQYQYFQKNYKYSYALLIVFSHMLLEIQMFYKPLEKKT